MDRYVTELVDTLLFVFTTGTVSGDLTPIAAGTALVAMVHMRGRVSGVHCAFSVTVGFHLRGRMAGADALRHMAAQMHEVADDR